MNRSLRIAILLGAAVIAVNIWAQSSDDTQPDPATDAASVTESANQDSATDSSAQNADGVNQDVAQVDDEDADAGRFIPTEQLSQDLGASFPVDI